jgi:hypothetical protein
MKTGPKDGMWQKPDDDYNDESKLGNVGNVKLDI